MKNKEINKCLTCKKKIISNDSRKKYCNYKCWSFSNRNKINQNHKKYRDSHKDLVHKRTNSWISINKDRYNKYRKIFMSKWRKDNPDLYKLYLLSNKLIKIPKNKLCESCNEKLAIERHHPDYNKPLEVKLLCVKCHKEIHKC